MSCPPFHLAIAVDSLDDARHFYSSVLGCTEGRSAERWVDFAFFGHQLSVHLRSVTRVSETNPVDGDDVPIPHFGAVLAWNDWHVLRDRLIDAEIQFVIAPRIRFQGEVGEQATMFFLDPSGNALEFKAIRDESNLFES